MDYNYSLGQIDTLAEYMILSGADNRPPMLDKDLYDSWKSRIELYMQNREHGRMILESVENGPLIWRTVEENGQEERVWDDPIVCLNKAMAFLTAVASSRFLRTQYKLREILLESKETKNYYSGWQSHCATSHGRQVSIVIWYWIIRVIATSSGGKCNAVQEGSWDQILDEQSNSHLYADLEVPVMVKLSKNNHFKQCCFSELRILILCSDCG
ncbi:hypothetical protein Tco_0458303 [Tanacetum coccineum]